MYANHIFIWTDVWLDRKFVRRLDHRCHPRARASGGNYSLSNIIIAHCQQSIVFQADAPQNSFMSPNWTASLGNDDQGFWGMSAMLAAEVNFPLVPGEADWLEMAQAVFNTQAAPDRHDDECGGGLRWQIYPSNAGYDYKVNLGWLRASL